MQKVVTKVSLHQQKSDFTYWQSQSYQSRLDVLEQIRREYHLSIVVNAPRSSQDAVIVPLTSKTTALLGGEFVLAEWKKA